jgi:hypothetical protein
MACHAWIFSGVTLESMYSCHFCAVLDDGRWLPHLNHGDGEADQEQLADGELSGTHQCQQKHLVLVRVVEVTQSGERVPAAEAKWRIKRLVALDDCPLGVRNLWDTIVDEPIPVVIGDRLVADGEPDLLQSMKVCTGLETVGDDLPRQVVKRGPEVVYRVADDQWQITGQRHGVGGDYGTITKVLIEVAAKPVGLASISLIPPFGDASLGGIEQLDGSTHLSATAIERRGHQSSLRRPKGLAIRHNINFLGPTRKIGVIQASKWWPRHILFWRHQRPDSESLHGERRGYSELDDVVARLPTTVDCHDSDGQPSEEHGPHIKLDIVGLTRWLRW